MSLEKMLIIGFLFLMTVFFFPDLETAINAVPVDEALKPVFNVIPYGILGSLFVAFITWGIKE